MLCDPMDCRTPGFPVFQYLPEFAQTHVHLIGAAIQPSHPVTSSSSCPQFFPVSGSFPVSQLFAWADKVLELQLQNQPFQWIVRIDFLQDWLIWHPFCLSNSQETSPEPQFQSLNPSALSLLHGPALTSIHDFWKTHSFDYMDLCQQSDVSAF